ncbi:MAG: insulinase family protein [Desulfobacterales bacterium]|nr:insulinase family protein [Desulfobacterales bacterium]
MKKEILDKNNPDLKEGMVIQGFVILKIDTIKTIDAVYYELEHRQTGAKYIHISNMDHENTFGVAFKTVPKDSTGVAHILEHTVLCGSKKYPVRDPFFAMLKRSLSTFMNAFTASDWTMYPFSTENYKDYYQLMDVYLDAVFFPKLDELSFKQEGCRIEFYTPEDEGEEKEEEEDKTNTIEADPQLVYKGVVYNEMKGAMSSADQVLVRSLLKSLYPLTTYSWNSGGDPFIIPQLTYEQLKTFHQIHYHPSNSFFYSYGNFSLQHHLAFIDEKVLRFFKRINPNTDVPQHPRWTTAKQIEYTYPLAKTDDPVKKCQVCVGWLMCDITNSYEMLVLIILNHILLGHSASPLRKALIDSQLGSALSDGSGYDSDNRDTLFVCGLKDVKETDADQVESIIFRVLNELATKGIEQELIESAIHQIELHRKEITNTPFPYGIKLLISLAGNWLHGGSPIQLLEIDENLDRLNSELSKGSLFERYIDTYLLTNSHRVRLILKPDQDMEEKEYLHVQQELKDILSNISSEQVDQIRNDAKRLQTLQDSEEDLSCLPTLEIEDIPKDIKTISPSTQLEHDFITCYEQPTSGIFYFTCAIGTGHLSESLLPYVPLFCSFVTRMGTTKYDYIEMAKKIDRYTGGIRLGSDTHTCYDKFGGCLPLISFSGKCLDRNIPHLFNLINDIYFEYQFNDMERLKNLLLEYRAHMESAIIKNGHRLAMSLASRNLTKASSISELWHGIHHLQKVKEITSDTSLEKLESVADYFKQLAAHVFIPGNIKIALVGESKNMNSGIDEAKSFLKNVGKTNDSSIKILPSEIQIDSEVREGWTTHAAVSFVANAFKTVRFEHEDAPCLSVMSKLFRSIYIHREIREKGGAYGGYASYNSEEGIFSFASYRDPNIVRTLDVFKKAGKFIRSGQIADDDIKEAILQVCSDIDKPHTPSVAARRDFYRRMVGLTDDARKAYKQHLLSLTRKNIIDIMDTYFSDDYIQKQGIAVISSQDKLQQANQLLKESPLSIYSI